VIFTYESIASKGYSDFVLLDKQKRIVEANFQLDDTFFGHQALCKFFEDFLYHPGATIYGGVESTGGYENNWYRLLWKLQERFNINISHVNPYGVKYFKEASLERINTDKISAKKIAEYIITYPEKVTYNQEDYFAPLRRHWKVLRLLKKQCAQLLNQLQSQLYVAHPQLLCYCSDRVPDWVLHVLEKYPTADKLALAKKKDLSVIPFVTEQRAMEMIEYAQKSVASTNGTSMEIIIKSLAKQILNLRKTINDQVKVMIKSYDPISPISARQMKKRKMKELDSKIGIGHNGEK
jgi:transposase